VHGQRGDAVWAHLQPDQALWGEQLAEQVDFVAPAPGGCPLGPGALVLDQAAQTQEQAGAAWWCPTSLAALVRFKWPSV